jgi:hypothetical protein
MLLLCWIFLAISMVGSPNKEARLKNFQEEIGTPITQADFDKLVNQFTTIFQKGDTIKDIKDYINLARLYNTIEHNGDLKKIDRYKKCMDLYSPKYFMVTIERLQAHPMKGMYDYSEKYDISLGGHPTNNSVFLIIKQK